jgi:hypothetical protein
MHDGQDDLLGAPFLAIPIRLLPLRLEDYTVDTSTLAGPLRVCRRLSGSAARGTGTFIP